MENPQFALSARALSARPVTARALCHDVPFVTPESDNAVVMDLFTTHKTLISLPVVEQNRPFGMINRHIFLSQMTRPFFRELYDRKSCIAFMDKNPLVIEADSALETVGQQMVASGDKSVADGFIITDNGLYLGMGLGIDVIRTVSDLQAQQHRQIMQSIEYARVIQEAMLDKSQQTMSSELQDWCLNWQPRDCVGGDFYAFHHYGHGWLMLMADCTGHGVPGAFMTVILSSALEKALASCEPDRPELVLQHINLAIKQTLGQFNQSQQTSLSNDGCDAMAIFVDTQHHRLVWAGGRITGFLVPAGEGDATLLESDRVGIGYTDTPVDYCWTRHEMRIKPQDVFFTWTDGLTDQIGGERRIMFGKRRIQALLEEHRHAPMTEMCQSLRESWLAWQGDEARRDDMSWFGFRY